MHETIEQPAITRPEPELAHPTLMRRDISTSIDLAVLLILVGTISLLPIPERSAADVLSGIFIVAACIYEPILVWRGATIGQLVTRIRVRQHDDEKQRISLVQSYVRFTLKVFLGIVSLAVILLNQRQRAIHDFAVDSIMIRLPD